MLGKRTRLDTSNAERDAEPVRRMLKFERDLKAQIARLKQQLDDTRRDLNILPQTVQKVVQIALELADQPPLIPGQEKGTFRMPALKGSWSVCATGLEHPHTRQVRPITFEADLAKGRDDVVLVHLNHRLVQMAMRLLRAEIWRIGAATQRGLRRISAQVVPSSALDTPVIIAHARLLVIGGDSHRLHEEIIAVGGAIREGRFQRLNVTQVADALKATQPREPADGVKQKLLALYPKLTDSLVQALEARKGDLLSGVEKKLNERAEKEANDIRTILTELKKAIEKELDQPEYVQLDLPGLADPERDEFERNKQMLRRRVQEIPAEIEREVDALKRRFSGLQIRVFPVAVTFLVPEKSARG
jgi:hypothetical protein